MSPSISSSPSPNKAHIITASVIIPVLNGEETIAACLDALLRQAYPRDGYEIIVVDNGSTDRTAQIVSTYPQVKLVREPQRGAYHARNRGIGSAQGEFLAFTDADCTPAPGWLDALLAPMADVQNIATAGTILSATPNNLLGKFLGEVLVYNDYFSTTDLPFHPLLTGNMAIRSGSLQALGNFDELLPQCGDIDLAWRLQHRFGECVCYAPSALVYHHEHTTLRNTYLQYKRHGMGEVHFDAVCAGYPGFPHTLAYQVKRSLRQIRALVIYFLSFGFQLLKYPIHRSRYRLVKPLLWAVIEYANLTGRLHGLVQTRLLRKPLGKPQLRSW